MRNDYFKCAQYLKDHLCLEISPLGSPILSPQDPNTRFFSIYDTEELKKKYAIDPNIDKSKIVDLHYVQKNKSFKETIGSDRFGLILSSHVVGYIPDLVRWLQDIESVLIEGGVLQLAVPDKRYCYDFRRQLTEISDIIGAYIDERKRPSPTSVYDFFMLSHCEVCNDPVLHHRGDSPKDFVPKKEYHQLAYNLAMHAKEEYIDVHCWVWTPDTFTQHMNFLYENGLIKLKLIEEEIVHTKINTFEFFVTLKKT